MEQSSKSRKHIAIAAVICSVVLAVLFAWVVFNLPYMKYAAAMRQIKAGNVIDAYETFMSLNDYKDSRDKANEIYQSYKQEKLKNISVGDILYFGSYEQDNNLSDGKEKIAWQVLDVEENKILVISMQGLDCCVFDNKRRTVTWEDSSIREWLNETFFSESFDSDEKKLIISEKITPGKNPKYNTECGNATVDKVFLLNIEETSKYFKNDDARQCKPTEYAKANGAYTDVDNGNCWWWSRSPGYSRDMAAFIHSSGRAHSFGMIVNYGTNGCVRPAMWIDIGH